MDEEAQADQVLSKIRLTQKGPAYKGDMLKQSSEEQEHVTNSYEHCKLLRKLLNPRFRLRQAVIRISIPQSLRHYAILAMHLRNVALHFRSLVLARPGEVSDREEEMRGILGQHARQGRVHGDKSGDLGLAHPMNPRSEQLTTPKTPPARVVLTEGASSPAASSQNVTSRQAKSATRATEERRQAIRKIRVMSAHEMR